MSALREILKGCRNRWSLLRRAAGQGRATVRQARLEDRIDLVFPGVRVTVRRVTHDPTPHELHVILPRVEIRKGCRGSPTPGIPCGDEIILSSITVVDAPRHPLAGERGPGPTRPQPPPPLS